MSIPMPNPNPNTSSRTELELRIDATAGAANPKQWLSVEQIHALADLFQAELDRKVLEELKELVEYKRYVRCRPNEPVVHKHYIYDRIAEIEARVGGGK